jgi:hypothetical protein
VSVRTFLIFRPVHALSSRHRSDPPIRAYETVAFHADGVLARDTHELGEELVGSYLYQVHLYHWLESHDYGRFLSDNDL